ncbi:YceI family protein [Flexivirga oryzae]|uniref:Polyisoprenoid-binding protein YceI n=1 Tax=Flexivirga oryzae TaxID=1794944 RepID=A0A839N808_9MICO|nr:YceI family protein [Flexivirga oryzae]MBB2892909.1 polyisoprenoid-binding protein YceI [Flexivirga oryzae]
MSTTTTTLDGLSTGTWNIDPAHSALGFQVRHMMVSKVRGKFDEFTATLTVGESLEDSSVAAEVTMASINTGVADRDNHLRTNDFFEVETYPTMTFRSTKLTPTELTGDLTIKNVTKPVTFDVELGGIGPDPYGNTRAGFEATLEINRKEFGVDIEMPLQGGGVVVGDKVKITLDLEFVKAQA